MSQYFQDLSRCLLAAGFASHPEGKGVQLLYVNPKSSDHASLIYKHWLGSSFGDQELITNSVHPNNNAAYLTSPTTQFIICVSTSSALRVLCYDKEEEEWFDWQPSIPQHEVHRNGKLAAVLDTDGRICVFFQDPSNHLIYLDSGSWATTVLPANPVVGSPISAIVHKDTMYVFYISAQDKCMHCITRRRDSWSDRVLANCTFNENVLQFTVAPTDQSGAFEAYVLTEGNTFKLLHITDKGAKVELGTVDAERNFKFISTRSVDLCCDDVWNGTLTIDRLNMYLANDPHFIDSPGGENNMTALAAACLRGRLDIVRLLLESGAANPNALSPQKRSPLFIVTSRCPAPNRHNIVCALLKAGANVDECYAENDFYTPLMNAVMVVSDKDVVRELLNAGASLTAKNVYGYSAAMLAEGTDMAQELPPPPEKESSPLEKLSINFFVALIVFVITYTNSSIIQEIVDEIWSKLYGDDSLDD